MEVLRAKFYELKPQAIEALAYSPDGVWLALARPGADIEIWNAAHQQVRFRIAGDSKKNIKAMVWKHDGSSSSSLEGYRLFGTGLHSEVVEYDLQQHCERSSVSTHGGAAFDMCETLTGLAVACDDGSVRLFDIAEDEVVYKSALKGPKSRILSVCCVGDMLFTGGSDDMICRWSLKTLVCDERMSVEKTKTGTLIWSLCSIGDGLIASGDSSGNVMIWDVKTCTLVRRFQQHQADVLSLAFAPKLGILASGGVDSKISLFSVSEGDVQFSNALFSHSHDIRALAARGTWLASGSPDAELHFHPLQTTKKKRWYQGTTPFAGMLTNPVSVSSKLVLCQHIDSADIWYLQPTEGAPKPIKMLNLKLDSSCHLLSSAICGDVVALSDDEGTRLFKMQLAEVKCRKLPAGLLKNIPATAMKFVGETKLVVCGRKGMHIYDIEEETLECISTKQEVPIQHLAHFGPWLAAADANGRVNVYNLDSLQHHCQVPAFEDGTVTAMCFDRSNKLMLVSSTHCWQYYDLQGEVQRGQLTHLRTAQRVLGIHASEGKFVFWGQDFMLKMNLSLYANAEHGVKRKLDQFNETEQPWQIEDQFTYALSMNVIENQQSEDGENDGAMKEVCLVCEVPRKMVKTMLPTQFQRKKFARARKTICA